MMKNLIAALVASAFALGASAQSATPATPATPAAPAAAPMDKAPAAKADGAMKSDAAKPVVQEVGAKKHHDRQEEARRQAGRLSARPSALTAPGLGRRSRPGDPASAGFFSFRRRERRPRRGAAALPGSRRRQNGGGART